MSKTLKNTSCFFVTLVAAAALMAPSVGAEQPFTATFEGAMFTLGVLIAWVALFFFGPRAIEGLTSRR